MKKRHLLPVLVGVSAAALGACDEKTTPAETVSEDRPKKKTKKKKKAKPIPTKVIRHPDDIPARLGGAVAPMPLPSPSASAPVESPEASKAPGAAAPQAASPRAAADSAAEPAPAALTLAHNHPPDEPCKPLTEDEVKKALADLQAK